MNQKPSQFISRIMILFMVAVNIVILLVGQADAINPQPEPPMDKGGLPALQEQVNAMDVDISTLQVENSAQQSLINALNADLITAQDNVIHLNENLITAQNMIAQLKNALFMEMKISRLRTQIQSVIADLILGEDNTRFEAALLDISSNILGNKIDSLWINEQASYWQQIILTEDDLRAIVQAHLVNQNQSFDIVDVEAGVALVTLTEVSTLDLQMMLDRRGKIITTLSNLMKKLSEAEDEIIQNIK
jgi:hypothetical protein